MAVLEARHSSSAVSSVWDIEPDETHTDRCAKRTAESITGGFNSTYRGLCSLLSHQASEDEAEPTPYAWNRMSKLLEKTFAIMRWEFFSTHDPAWRFPKGYASTDDYGGVRIEWWHNRTICVTVAVGHNTEAPTYAFIKLKAGEKGSMHRAVFPAWLATQLYRLNQAAQHQG